MMLFVLICSISITELCSLIGTLTAIITAFVAICKYSEYIRKERIQYLLDFGNKYISDPEIKEVVLFLENLEDDSMYKSYCFAKDGSYRECALPIHSIEMFMRFIEELELLIRSGAVSESAALNLFGHYTTILDRYHSRWPKLGYNEKYWNIYRDFVKKAKNFDYKNISL